MTISIRQTRRAAIAASLLGGVLLTAIATGSHAQQPAATSAPVATTAPATPEDIARATLRSETRIRRLHDSLQITAAEEDLWAPVAKVMRDNEAAFRGEMKDTTAGMKSQTAVTDLKTFQIVADHHASGLKKFIPAFSALYETMPAAQQKRADRIFGENSRSSGM